MSDTEEKNIFIHTLDFDNFIEFVGMCNLAHCFTIYTMPNKNETYSSLDNVTELIKTLNDYNASEEWRMNVTKNLPFIVDKDTKIIQVGNYIIKDALQIIIIAPINMAFIIPGPESKMFKPCEIIQLNNLVRQQPMVFNFKDVEEDGKHRLVGEFTPILMDDKEETVKKS